MDGHEFAFMPQPVAEPRRWVVQLRTGYEYHDEMIPTGFVTVTVVQCDLTTNYEEAARVAVRRYLGGTTAGDDSWCRVIRIEETPFR